jgi:hypothetical protein
VFQRFELLDDSQGDGNDEVEAEKDQGQEGDYALCALNSTISIDLHVFFDG